MSESDNQALEYLEANWAELWRNYAGLWIAIRDNRVVGAHKDLRALKFGMGNDDTLFIKRMPELSEVAPAFPSIWGGKQ